MSKTEVCSNSLTVYFEDPFWVGVFERVTDQKLMVCRTVFGSEPKDYEVWKFILDQYDQLAFGPTVSSESAATQHLNPKRKQREAVKQMQQKGISTKSQQALKLQQEQKKITRRIRTREQREEEQQRLFALKQQKRKEKHRGR